MVSGAYDPRRHPGEDVLLARPHHAVALRAEAPAPLRQYVLAGVVRQDEVKADGRVTGTVLRTHPFPGVAVEEQREALAAVALTAYLGAQTVWNLVFGWIQMVREANAATTFDELRAAGERYGRLIGVFNDYRCCLSVDLFLAPGLCWP